MKRTLRKRGAGILDTLKNTLSKKTYGSRLTGSKADVVGTWKGDPAVAPPVRKAPPPKFEAPSPPPSNPGSVASTPPRSESPPTAVQKLAARKTNVDDIVKGTNQSTDPKIRYFGTQRDVRSGRRLRKRKTHRRRR